MDVGAEVVKTPELSCEAETVEEFLGIKGVESINQEVTAVFDRQLGLWVLAFPMSKTPGTLCFMRTSKCVEERSDFECSVKN